MTDDLWKAVKEQLERLYGDDLGMPTEEAREELITECTKAVLEKRQRQIAVTLH